MRTGISFFDDQDPKVGDLWIVASGPAMGRSTIVRNVAVGIADNLVTGRVAYWDLERTYATWRTRIEAMGSDVPAVLDYRNESARGTRDLLSVLDRGAQSIQHVLVVVDNFGLFTDDVVEDLKTFKNWLVRAGRMGLVGMQLPRSVWGKMKTEGDVNPDSLPEHLLDSGDAVFACGKTPQGEVESGAADTLRVVVCKSPTGLRDPHNHRAFIWHQKTGRID